MQPRAVESGDVPGIQALIGRVYGEYGCVLDLEAEDRHLLDPGAYFRPTGGEFWVVEENGAVCATAAVLLHEDTAELKSLYIDATCRRRGWGARLVDVVLRHSCAAGRGRVFLWSDTRFVDAHRFYERLGFTRMGVRWLCDLNRTAEYGFFRVL